MTLPGKFWRLAASSGMSNLADGVFAVALPLLALQLTRSPLAISGLAVAAGLPWLLFALFAGVIVDRVDRRRLMIWVQFTRAATIGSTAALILAGGLQLWHLYVLALMLGVAETLFDTAAQSVLPALLSKDRLAEGNSRLYGVEVVGNTFAGPPIGGLLVAIAPALALASSTGGYIVAAVLLGSIAGRFRPHKTTAPTSIRADIGEGLTYLWGHLLLRRLALLVGGISLTASAFFAVLPVYAVAPGPMGLSETQYGLFLTSSGIGAVVASLTTERLISRLGSALTLHITVGMVALMLASPILVHPFVVAAALAAGGYFVVAWNVITVTLRQRLIPDHLLGRVNSAYRLLAWGSIPIGAGIGGLVAETTDIRVTFALAALTSLALLLFMRPITTEMLES